MQWSKEFSYSGGYSGECITELVTDGLEEGTEYDVLVTVDAGELAGSSSSSITFSKFSQISPTYPLSSAKQNMYSTQCITI